MKPSACHYEVAGETVSSGPAAPALGLVLADPASAFEVLEVPHRCEDLRVLPDLLEGGLPDISQLDGEIGARGNLSIGVDPAIADAGNTAPGPLAHIEAHLIPDAHELGGACRPDGHLPPRVLLENLPDHLLVHRRGDVLDLYPPARGYQEEELDHFHPKLLSESENILDVVKVLLGHRSVELDPESVSQARLDPLDGPLPSPGHTPELVMDLGGAGVETDRDGSHAVLFEFHGDLVVYSDGVGAQAHPQALIRSVLGELEDVLSEEGLSTAQDQNGLAHIDDLVDEHLSLLGGEFVIALPLFSVHVTVGAPEVAFERGVPGDDPWHRPSRLPLATVTARMIHMFSLQFIYLSLY